jgi:hypothetical protein
MITFYILAFCRVATGLVFAISSLSKARNIPKFKQAILGFNLLPPRLSSLAAIFILCSEFAVVLLIVIGGPLLLYGFVLATLLLLIFCAALASALARRLQTSCNCFRSNEKLVTSADIWRNLGFVLCAVGGCGMLGWTREMRVSLGNIEWLLISLSALVFVLIWIQFGEIVQLFRQS